MGTWPGAGGEVPQTHTFLGRRKGGEHLPIGRPLSGEKREILKVLLWTTCAVQQKYNVKSYVIFIF